VATPAKLSSFPDLQVYIMRVVSQPRYGYSGTVATIISERTRSMSHRLGVGCFAHITIRVRGPTEQPQSINYDRPGWET
jgi:hypothetical protein